jgi:signal transduction histidine kinase
MPLPDVGLRGATDVLIALAFLAVAISTLVLVRRGKEDLPRRWMFLLFALFMICCAVARILDAWTLVEPAYTISGVVLGATMVAAIATVIAMPRLLGAILTTVRAARLSEDRRSELELAHRDLQAVIERLKESERARSEVFANVSHELRTPLSLILGPAQSMLEQSDLSPEWRRALRTVVRNARLLEKHVGDLLMLAKGETGEVELKPSYVDVDLADLVRRTAANFDVVSAQREIQFFLDVPPRLSAELDRDAIERVLINLLSNAFKFTPERGRIRCSLSIGSQGRARISVGDSGPGIPENMRQVVFERFRQVDSSATRLFGGFGLGLAIVRSFVEMHGGTVHIDTAPEGGALFVVELPLKAPAGEQVTHVRPSAPIDEEIVTADLKIDFDDPPTAPGVPREKPKILVVEDNRDMNRFITSSLEPEYRTVSAYDGRSGLQKATRERPDLIVTDVMMPHMSGDDFVRRLRSLDALSQIPILVVSARDDSDLRTTMLKDGAQDYLTKPFVAEELRARVRNLVTAKRARDLLSVEVSNQRMDLEAMARNVASHRRDLEMALDETQIARKMAEQASGMKSNLLRMMSHELRTPVTAVQLQLALFERNSAALTEGQKTAIARVNRALQRLLDLIETALEYARIESGRFEIRRSRFSLAELVDEVIADFSAHAEMKSISLSASAEPSLPLLESDRTLLRLVTVNLVGNAVKFTQEGRVEVRLLHDGSQHVLIVSDSGPGIPPDLHDEVFEPFKQVGDIRRREGTGSGLGLALVKEMVQAIGGSIELQSMGEGSGSTFIVHIPPAGRIAASRSSAQIALQ